MKTGKIGPPPSREDYASAIWAFTGGVAKYAEILMDNGAFTIADIVAADDLGRKIDFCEVSRPVRFNRIDRSNYSCKSKKLRKK